MKALPKPRLLMLWIARLYALWVFGFIFLHLLLASSSQPDTVVITRYPHAAYTTGNSTRVFTHHGPSLSLCAHALLYTCLAFGLLMLNRQYGRVMAGTAAAGVLLYGLCEILNFAYLIAISNSVSVELLYVKLPLIIASYLANFALLIASIFLALRPPVETHNSDGDDASPFATPQSL